MTKYQRDFSENQDDSAPANTPPPVPQWRIATWFPELEAEKKELLKSYHSELVKFNKTLNLVSAKTLLTADQAHFADSLLAARIVLEKCNKNDNLYDIGSGNGFPGIVFGILEPTLKVVLVDSDQRKCEFLKHVISSLKLNNVSVQNKNIEKFSDGEISQAVCRGFAPLSRAMLTLRKVFAQGGTLYHLKSEEWSMEMSQVPAQLFSAWNPVLIGEYAIPESPAKMYIVSTEKK